MTEREILKHFVDSAPEHPAVVAYREWAHAKDADNFILGIAFLAGWKRALEWTASESSSLDGSRSEWLCAANATPERLP